MNTFTWTTENLFSRERFEAWLANQPGEREFDYFDSRNCLLCNFIRETSSFPLRGVGPWWVRNEMSEECLNLPVWIKSVFDVVLEEYKTKFITISMMRTAYQTLYGIDLTPKRETVEENLTGKI